MRKQFYLKLCLLLLCFGMLSTLNAQIIQVNSIQCFGQSNGQLAAVDTFGTSPYTYLWSNGHTTQNIDGLPAGNYTVTVTENGGGSHVYSYLLTQPAPITVTYTLTPNGSWPINNGSILIHANGGTPPYNYTVFDSIGHKTKVQLNPLFGSLASGSYFITITDLYGCQLIDTVKVLENAGLAVTTALDTTACYMSTAGSSVKPALDAVYPVLVNFGDSTFFTVLDTVMGPNPYVMSTPGDTLPAVGDMFMPGFHVVTVSSADGKGFRYSWTVDSVVAPISISWTKTNVICFGMNTASLTSLAQGSWMGFTYSITGPAGFSVAASAASNLYAGEYHITATDFTGCSLSQTVFISQPDEPLHVVFDIPTNPRCPYAADGALNIHRVDGAIDPITYLWSTGEHTIGIDSLYPGKYTVSVTDSNSCVTTDSITLKPDRRGCIFNIVTPNGDGYNDYLDLTDICKGMTMKAQIFNEAGNLIATFDETNPRWDPADPANPPTGTASSYTVFIDLSKNNLPYKKWSEGFSVIYPK